MSKRYVYVAKGLQQVICVDEELLIEKVGMDIVEGFVYSRIGGSILSGLGSYLVAAAIAEVFFTTCPSTDILRLIAFGVGCVDLGHRIADKESSGIVSGTAQKCMSLAKSGLSLFSSKPSTEEASMQVKPEYSF